MHPETLVIEYLLDPINPYPKLPRPKSRSEHTDFPTQNPRGAELLVAGDLNVDLNSVEGNKHDEKIMVTLSAARL